MLGNRPEIPSNGEEMKKIKNQKSKMTQNGMKWTEKWPEQ